MTTTIDSAHADDLYHGDDGSRACPWTRIDDQETRTGCRSTEGILIVADDAGDLYGVRYEKTLTEDQNYTLSWQERGNVPLPLVRLYRHQVTTTVYGRTEPAV